MKTTTKAATAVATVALALTGGTVAVGAAPGARHPTLTVVGYGAVQTPHDNGSVTAVGSPHSSHCTSLIADDDGSFPGPYLVEPGTEQVRIALHTPVKPAHRSLSVYARSPRNDPHQKPVHPGSRLLNARGEWKITTTLRLGVHQQAYLALDVAWKNARCGGRDDYRYNFHVKAAG